MMKNNKLRMWSPFLLAGCLSATAFAAGTLAERPRPENYPTYSQYLQALFDYRKAQLAATPGGGSDDLCKDTSGGKGAQKKPTACEKRVAIISDLYVEAGTPQDGSGEPGAGSGHEDLEEAVARANAGVNPGYVDTSAHPRTTFKSFPLDPIPATDLSQAGVTGLLGFFGALIPPQQIAPGTTSRLRSDSAISLTPDTDLRSISDVYSLAITGFEAAGVSFGALLHLTNGTGTIEGSAASTPTGSSLTLSANVRTGMYMVDRDGIPGTFYSGAGAVTIDSLGIQFQDIHADINATNLGNTGSADLLNVQVQSPHAITVDFSGTHIGVADAMADGSRIGSTTNFLVFGPKSVLTIEPGMNLTTVLSHPDGIITPLLTLNGNIGNLSLSDVSLVDGDNTALRIGQLSVDGIRLVNTRIFLDQQQQIIIDMGTGITNMSVGLERVSLGNDPTAGSVGDVYVSHVRVSNMLMTVAAH